MKLNKCFQTVFDPAMKQAGFSRKGILFYRVKGVMLQGIRLETTNPYFITFSTFPYWLYTKRTKPLDLNLARGNWVQSGGLFLINTYYMQDLCDQNMKDMERVFELVQDYILPYLDRVNNEKEYFQMVLNGPTELLPRATEGAPFIRAQERPTAEIFLYNQHNNSPTMAAEEAVEIWHNNRLSKYLKHAEESRIDEHYIQLERDSLLEYRDSILEKIDSINQQGFLQVYEAMCTEMKQLLREQLKIDIDMEQ